jgi:glyoxylase-like metal-dependent hydrolase (beta-lactamase superfamily II)
MDKGFHEVVEGIVRFEGSISRNMMLETIVSNSYFLQEEEEVIIFDPSCGKKIARRIEESIARSLRDGSSWKRAYVVAGHSHFDHANNFYLADLLGAEETHVLVHESGFRHGEVMNHPRPFVEKIIDQTKEYYAVYSSFFLPYRLLIAPFAIIDAVAPELAKKTFSLVGSIAFPPPHDGSARAEALIEAEMEDIDLGGAGIRGWRLGDKVLIPTPGHSPCSISLLWPARRAILVSDADWIGNPVFVDSSLRDSRASLEAVRGLVETGIVDILLPAHGNVKKGMDYILSYLDFHIHRLRLIREEILSYCDAGHNTDVLELTRDLTRRSPLFASLKHSNYPRFVMFVSNMVARCLLEEGRI